MVPYPPAGGADTTARIVYAKVSQLLGQQFVIENRGGAGGTIGEAVVAKADPDGYTILHDGTAHSINGALYSNLSFDYNKDFDAVALVSLVPNILVVTPSLPVKTMADVIAYAKAAPGGIDMASSGNGTLQHLSLEMFRFMTGTKVNHVPYRGGGLALNDVIGGQVKFFLRQRLVGGRPDPGRPGQGDRPYRQGPAQKPAGHSAGVRHLARASRPMNGTACSCRTARRRRSCRRSTPRSTKRCARPRSKRASNSSTSNPRQNTPEEFRAFVKEQMERWSKVVKEANIKLG